MSSEEQQIPQPTETEKPKINSPYEIASDVVQARGDLSQDVRVNILRRLSVDAVPKPVQDIVNTRVESEVRRNEIFVTLESARAGFIICDELVGNVTSDRKKEDARQIYSVADKLSSEAIAAVFAAHFPDYGRVDEESGVLNPDTEKCFISDPLDGSASFMRNIDGWAVGLALHEKADVEKGGSGVTLGVVASPQRKGKEVIFGGKEIGCFDWEGKEVHVSEVGDPNDMSFSVGSRDVRESDWRASLQAMGKSVSRVFSGTDTQFSSSMVASGSLDFMVRIQQPSYDIAPVVGIVEGAGGKVREIDGRDIVIRRDLERRHNIFAWNSTEEVRQFFDSFNGYGLDQNVAVEHYSRPERQYAPREAKLADVLQAGAEYHTSCLLPAQQDKYLVRLAERFGPGESTWDFPVSIPQTVDDVRAQKEMYLPRNGPVNKYEDLQTNPEKMPFLPSVTRDLQANGNAPDQMAYRSTPVGMEAFEEIPPNVFFPIGAVSNESAWCGVVNVPETFSMKKSGEYRWLTIEELQGLAGQESGVSQRLKKYVLDEMFDKAYTLEFLRR